MANRTTQTNGKNLPKPIVVEQGSFQDKLAKELYTLTRDRNSNRVSYQDALRGMQKPEYTEKSLVLVNDIPRVS